MTFVVDASVALKWFVSEEGSTQAATLLAGLDALIAPDLIVAEVVNAAWRAVRAGGMSDVQHDRVAARLGAAFDELVPLGSLAPRAAVVSRSLDHPAYDCFYLALAETRAARLVTADRRLLGHVAGTQWERLATDLYAMSSA